MYVLYILKYVCTLCLKKTCHPIVAIILSNLNHFQNSFTAGQSVIFSTTQYITLSTTPKMCCCTTSRNLNVKICCIFCILYCVPIKGSYQTHGGNFITPLPNVCLAQDFTDHSVTLRRIFLTQNQIIKPVQQFL